MNQGLHSLFFLDLPIIFITMLLLHFV